MTAAERLATLKASGSLSSPELFDSTLADCIQDTLDDAKATGTKLAEWDKS